MNCFYLSGGLLSPEHTARIGNAIWEFLWFISHETKEGGKVLNGQPIAIDDIAKDLGEHYNTADVHIDSLCQHGYIARERSEVGESYSYRITKPKKWKFAGTQNGTVTPVSQKTSSVTKTSDGVSHKIYTGVTRTSDCNKESREVRDIREINPYRFTQDELQEIKTNFQKVCDEKDMRRNKAVLARRRYAPPRSLVTGYIVPNE